MQFPDVTRHYIREYQFDFLISDPTAAEWYASEHQNLPEYEWCIDHIKPGDTVVDCGAHHGMTTMMFARATGQTGRVYAYEALPMNAGVIIRNAEINEMRNVIVRPLAVSDYNGSAYFHGNLTNGCLAQNETASERVVVVRLDDDLPESVKVDFIKIDVEGSDVGAVNGAMRVLSSRPVIDLELHNFLFKDRRASLNAIFGALAPLRYRFAVLLDIWGKVEEKGSEIDLGWLAQFDNPHVFCVPIP